MGKSFKSLIWELTELNFERLTDYKSNRTNMVRYTIEKLTSPLIINPKISSVN